MHTVAQCECLLFRWALQLARGRCCLDMTRRLRVSADRYMTAACTCSCRAQMQQQSDLLQLSTLTRLTSLAVLDERTHDRCNPVARPPARNLSNLRRLHTYIMYSAYCGADPCCWQVDWVEGAAAGWLYGREQPCAAAAHPVHAEPATGTYTADVSGAAKQL